MYFRLLVEHGAEVACVNLDGNTPLDIALDAEEEGCPAVAKYLQALYKQKGCDLKALFPFKIVWQALTKLKYRNQRNHSS